MKIENMQKSTFTNEEKEIIKNGLLSQYAQLKTLKRSVKPYDTDTLKFIEASILKIKIINDKLKTYCEAD